MRHNNITPTILHPPKERNYAKNCLQNLSIYQRTRLSMHQGWCVPDIYPFCFPNYRPGRGGNPPALGEYTCWDNSNNLRECLANSLVGEFRLPKHILIDDTERSRRVYLGPEVTRPPSALQYRETAEYWVLDTTGHTMLSPTPPPHAAMTIMSPSIGAGLDGMGEYTLCILYPLHKTCPD